jgi:signal transduction histidine kinase
VVIGPIVDAMEALLARRGWTPPRLDSPELIDDRAGTELGIRVDPEFVGPDSCHHDRMGGTGRVLARALTWPLVPACLVLTWAVDSARPGPGDALVTGADLPYLTAVVATWSVGIVLTARAPAPAAGWAFLGLATSLTASGLFDDYADLAVNRRPDVPFPGLAATLSDSSWVWWLVFIALVLCFTPPTLPSGALLRRLPLITVLMGLAYQIGALLRPIHLDPPYEDVVSPWALPGALGTLMSVLAFVAVFGVGLCVLGSAVALVLGWRRADGETRRQLLWLVAGALAVLTCVVAAFAFSIARHNTIAALMLSLAIVCLTLGAALSVLRYRLYDVERVVIDSAGYAAAAAAVVVVFLAMLALVSRTTPADARGRIPTVLATLVGAAVARSVYVAAKRAAEKRVNRDRFDAVESVRLALARAPTDLDVLLRDALGDPTARLLYPANGSWITTRGRVATPGTGCVDVRRGSEVTAKLEFDPVRVDRDVVEAVARTAGTEIDNVALRAELARQLEVVNQSRARLATAHADERRRLERDLHDGAQQRLLALALQLQSARINGGSQMLVDEVDRAIAELSNTVQDLRHIAGGLQPAALSGGGLLGAVIDMAGRAPVRVRYDVVDKRFPPEIESAAWFVISEAVTNVVKYADVDEVQVCVTTEDDRVRVVVADDGVGGADTSGNGIQGLTDRVGALGGTLYVTEHRPHGTRLEAVLPCES